jgi:hypothetical protein
MTKIDKLRAELNRCIMLLGVFSVIKLNNQLTENYNENSRF